MLATAATCRPCASVRLGARPFGQARVGLPARRALVVRASTEQQDKQPALEPEALATAALAGAALLLPLVAPEAAFADAPEWAPALLKGRIFSLMHPAIMIFLFGGSLWAGYLGLQWRHTRELAATIKEKKGLLPPPDAEGKRPVTPLDSEIAALEAERKELIGKKLNEKHANWGYLLLGLGVTISVAGAFNTFLRTGKLFPGPHLYAGAAITVLWALATACVPQMQKGNETARSAHIAFNTLNILLFAWQLPTGFEIVDKVMQFTSFP